MDTIFFISLFLVFYIYFGYPVFLYILAKFVNRKVLKSDFQPNVTILIAAYNEAKYIANTIENKLALNYPKNKLEIIVTSDASEDGTDEIVNSYAQDGVKLIRQSPRQGKTAALNLAIDQANGEIIVFSDANSIYDADALQHLVDNFSDASVGYVTGKMVYVDENGSMIGDGCSSYMKYENILRSLETYSGSIVGVDGGIDAVRKSLHKKMNADQLPDFVLPLHIATQMHHIVYEPNAILKETSLSDSSSEYNMRIRVALRAMWALLDMRHLFNIKKYGLFSFKLISHKLLRYLAFIPLSIILICNLFLFNEHIFYQFSLLAQLTFYIFALIGHIARNKKTSIVFTLPYYFTLLNVSSAHAFWNFIHGKKKVIWNPRLG